MKTILLLLFINTASVFAQNQRPATPQFQTFEPIQIGNNAPIRNTAPQQTNNTQGLHADDIIRQTQQTALQRMIPNPQNSNTQAQAILREIANESPQAAQKTAQKPVAYQLPDHQTAAGAQFFSRLSPK